MKIEKKFYPLILAIGYIIILFIATNICEIKLPTLLTSSAASATIFGLLIKRFFKPDDVLIYDLSLIIAILFVLTYAYYHCASSSCLNKHQVELAVVELGREFKEYNSVLTKKDQIRQIIYTAPKVSFYIIVSEILEQDSLLLNEEIDSISISACNLLSSQKKEMFDSLWMKHKELLSSHYIDTIISPILMKLITKDLNSNIREIDRLEPRILRGKLTGFMNKYSFDKNTKLSIILSNTKVAQGKFEDYLLERILLGITKVKNIEIKEIDFDYPKNIIKEITITEL